MTNPLTATSLSISGESQQLGPDIGRGNLTSWVKVSHVHGLVQTERKHLEGHRLNFAHQVRNVTRRNSATRCENWLAPSVPTLGTSLAL